MSRTSKSPRAVALEALATARRALPAYASRFSRHDFTLAQHFACLVLKSLFRTDYRGVSACSTPRESPAIRRCRTAWQNRGAASRRR